MRAWILLALALASPASASEDGTMLDLGLVFTGATPFFNEGGGILGLGGAQVSDGLLIDARLNLVPAFTIDWGMGKILGSNENYPISAALSGSRTDKAWFPMANALFYLSEFGKPGFTAELAFNTVPKERSGEPEDYLAVPIAVGVGFPIGGEGLILAPSATVGWSVSKFTGVYSSFRLMARTTTKVGGYLRAEVMVQEVRGTPEAYLYTGTLFEFGVSFRLGED